MVFPSLISPEMNLDKGGIINSETNFQSGLGEERESAVGWRIHIH
jgi:hypothetical protein